MMSLFSSFDKSIYFSPFILFLFMFLLLMNYSLKNNYHTSVIKSIFSFLNDFFSSIKPLGFSKSVFLLLNSLMFMIYILNFSSVLSFNFPETSQVSSILFASLSLWVSLVLFLAAKNLKGFLSHCIPEGTPIYLTMFLFLIELTSNLIRPVTLTVRLVANILAGHLLMILLSKMVLSFLVLTPLYVVLNVVEIFVALIQSYIFVTMVTLYYSELG